MTRHDMFVEWASELVNEASETCYEELHAWLQPIFIKWLSEQYATEDDGVVQDAYRTRLGLDLDAA